MRLEWNNVLMFCYIFLFMFIAKILKEKLGIFKSIVFPTALLAGFLGLVFGPEVLGNYRLSIGNFSIPLGFQFDIKFYESIIFFFMIIGFVSLTLTERQNKQNSTSLDCGIFIVSTYVLQGIIGLGVLYLMISTFWPKFFPGLGLLLPLGFGQGPGLASEIGHSWDESLKSLNLDYNIQQFGLTIAAIGFIVGGVGGVIMLNYYIRKYNLKPVNLREMKGIQSKEVNFKTPNEINFFDNLMVQIVWLALVLFLTYLISLVFYNQLIKLGDLGKTVADLILGFSYIFGIFIAMGIRGLLRYFESRGHRTHTLIDDYMMRNISSFALNVMITASIMAIDISSIKQFLSILIGVSLAGTIGTWLYCVYFGRFIFRKNPIHYILTMFGMLTGVAATGLALLRGVDPDLDTETSDNVVVLGSAIATPFGFPLFVLLGFPVIAYKTNDILYEYYTVIGLIIYFIILVGLLLLRVKFKYKIKKHK